MAGTNGNGNGNGAPKVGTDTVKQGLAQMLKGGVIVSWPTVLGGFSFRWRVREAYTSAWYWTAMRRKGGSDAYLHLRRIFSSQGETQNATCSRDVPCNLVTS